MAKLIYPINISLDGYMEDQSDNLDECHLLVHPIILGGGKRALPDKLSVKLDLLSESRFKSGVAHLHYQLNHSSS